jgi:hypothetical protein
MSLLLAVAIAAVGPEVLLGALAVILGLIAAACGD